MEYSNCCRICLLANSNLVGIFEFSNGIAISEKIMYCASVEINAIDRLPQHICSTCKNHLDIAFKFKIDCEESYKKLQRIINLENISIIRNSRLIGEGVYKNEVVFFDDSSLLHEETVSTGIDTEIELVDNSYSELTPIPIGANISADSDLTEQNSIFNGLEINTHEPEIDPLENDNTDRSDEDVIKSDRSDEELYKNDRSDIETGSKDEKKVVVIQMNVHDVADISNAVTEKLNKSPVGRHIAKKQSSQVPRRINTNSNDSTHITCNSKLKVEYKISKRRPISPIDNFAMITKTDSSSYSDQTTSETDVANKTLLFCTTCNKSFETKPQLSRHFKRHNAKPSYFCDTCHKVFRNKYNLHIHTLKHTGNFPLKCMVCKMGFANTSTLERHALAHSVENYFACKYCNKQFAYESNLKLHEAIHVDRPKLTCDICFKLFSYTNSLRAHMKSHKGEKPFACKLCSSVFTRNTSLRRHLQQNHNQDKIFACKVCEQEFPTTEECKQHEFNIHLKLNCDFCTRKFDNKALLASHLKIHKIFACKTCNKKYKSYNALSIHCKSVH